MKAKQRLGILLGLAAALGFAALITNGVELPALPSRSSSTAADRVMAGLATVPLAAPWLVQLSALVRGR